MIKDFTKKKPISELFIYQNYNYSTSSTLEINDVIKI